MAVASSPLMQQQDKQQGLAYMAFIRETLQLYITAGNTSPVEGFAKNTKRVS